MAAIDAERLVEVRFPARSDELKGVRRKVRATLEAIGCSGDFVDTTVLAVDEAVCNVLRHAYCGDENGEVILQILKDGKTLTFRVIDFAAPVAQCEIKSRDLDDIRPGGLGVYLIQEIMDTMTFREPPAGAGNMLEMTRKLECG